MPAPTVTVLQLDTRFPRVPGDVGCAETFCDTVEIIRVPQATVAQVVTSDPHSIPIAPFEDALRGARGDVVVTSCGFLSPWQDHLAAQNDRPFISSALLALDTLPERPEDILTLTFDAERLGPPHLRGHACDVQGLPADMHLRQTIANDAETLDTARAERELVDHVTQVQRPNHRHLLLECTNLPPYKAAMARATGLPVTDILTLIEDARPGTVRPAFL
ncbi:hypothetical protein [Tateyamaria sp. SN6-1]|uniref:hypothetical protein n=1 Tax=Tateyamaria sp. SN6-1 TaxID=3092148 RepID=UPI0039F557C1